MPGFPEPLTFSDTRRIQGNLAVLHLDRNKGWIGVSALDTDGNALSSVGSGAVTFQPGLFQLKVALTPTSKVLGEVQGLGNREPLFAEIRSTEGKRLPLPTGQQEPQSPTAINAGGGFEFSDVPVGNSTVAVGSLAQLASGSALATSPVRVQEGSPARILIER